MCTTHNLQPRIGGEDEDPRNATCQSELEVCCSNNNNKGSTVDPGKEISIDVSLNPSKLPQPELEISIPTSENSFIDILIQLHYPSSKTTLTQSEDFSSTNTDWIQKSEPNGPHYSANPDVYPSKNKITQSHDLSSFDTDWNQETTTFGHHYPVQPSLFNPLVPLHRSHQANQINRNGFKPGGQTRPSTSAESLAYVL